MFTIPSLNLRELRQTIIEHFPLANCLFKQQFGIFILSHRGDVRSPIELRDSDDSLKSNVNIKIGANIRLDFDENTIASARRPILPLHVGLDLFGFDRKTRDEEGCRVVAIALLPKFLFLRRPP